MTEEKTCSYRNPHTGQACQCLKSVPNFRKQNFLAFDPRSNRDWCLIHFPYGEAKESLDPSMQIQLLGAVVKHSSPIDLTGACFQGSDFPSPSQDKTLILDDAVVDGSLVLRSPISAFSGIGMKLGGSLDLPSVGAGGANLSAAEISGSLSILSSGGSLSFKGVHAGGSISVSCMVKPDNRMVSFKDSTIDGDLTVELMGNNILTDLRRCTISGCLSILGRQGSTRIHGRKISVSGDTTISGPMDLVCLDDGTFCGAVSIRGEHAELRGNRAEFGSVLCFEKFSANTVFLRGIKSNSVFSMINALVRELLDCGDAHFAELSYFMASQFEKATFYRARFDGPAMLCGTRFVVGAQFEEVVAKNRLDFTPKWKGNGVDAKVLELPRLTFAHADLNEVDFSGREFESEVTFFGATFSVAPNFFNCKLHESVNFPLTLDSYADRSEESRSRYRTLKQKMEAVRARPEEAIFFALEQYCSRPGLPWVGRLISHFYGRTSQYGWSIGKPIFYLGICVLMFGSVFGQMEVGSVEWPRAIDWNAAGGGFKVSLQNVFLPFYAVRDSSGSLIEILLSILQSLVSIALIAEMLLAVRWRFRRG